MSGLMIVGVEALCTAAALELNILMAGGTLSANQGSVILGILNRIIDAWNAQPGAIYTLSTVAALTDSLTLPTGYQDALTLTLAERIAAPFGATVPPELAREARQARATVKANNDLVPSLETAEPGMPGYGEGHAYDYLTGY